MDNTELMKIANTLQEVLNTAEMKKIQVQGNRTGYVMENFLKQLPESYKKPSMQGINAALLSMSYLAASFAKQEQLITNMTSALQNVLDKYVVVGLHPKDIGQTSIEERDKISEKVLSEIYLPDENKIITTESPRITLLPANSKILAYLAENPEKLRELGSREFEKIMAEIYNRLGYDVELTKETRDGGKDIIIRKPDMLGDLVFYVECKQYSPKRKIGVDIVERFSGVIELDKVNGGVIATTSFFSPDAQKLILNKNLNYKIQMHDFDRVKKMLKIAAK